jgi:hypothetical protein
MAPCKLHIDLGERIAHAVTFVDQTVVDTDHPENYRGNNAQENQE